VVDPIRTCIRTRIPVRDVFNQTFEASFVSNATDRYFRLSITGIDILSHGIQMVLKWAHGYMAVQREGNVPTYDPNTVYYF
jgi:hypothetical protein